MIRLIVGLSLAGFSFPLVASDKVIGHSTQFTSPNGVKEQCIALKHMPGGIYSQTDQKTEKNYCSMDIYANTGICPKTWSTSPGTMFYPLKGSQYNSIRQFESNVCHNQRHVPVKAVAFKNTMNMKDTSGTFSTASLLYYHFSRYLNSQIKVPVAVYRSIDKNVHRQRVAHTGASITHKGMIHNAWKDMLMIEKNPTSYHPVDELFTQDHQQIYGALIRSTGKRYNQNVNGSRKSGWGEGQSRDFEKTPPFLALRSQKPLAQAASQRGHNLSKEQIVFWMKDIIEITLLDYIFSQQDRIGNIDYTKVWVSASGDQLKRSNAKPSNSRSLLIKQTHLNDNDAGGRYSYANFTKKTGMLEMTRHYNAKTYQQLMKLDKDFSQQGELYHYLSETFGLSKKQTDMIVKNTHMAAEIIRNNCLNKKLIFDLEPEQFFINGSVKPVKQSCQI